MPKLDFRFIEIAHQRMCSPINLMHISRTALSKNTGGLPLHLSSDSVKLFKDRALEKVILSLKI